MSRYAERRRHRGSALGTGNHCSAVDRIRTHREESERHGRASFTYLAPHSPDAGVSPKSREEVVEVLRFADGSSVPVVLYGEGSSLEGHTIPMRGELSLDFGLINEILEVRPGDFVALRRQSPNPASLTAN